MKLRLCIGISLFALSLSLSCSESKMLVLPPKISSLKVGLRVKHSNKQVYAVLNDQYPERGARYKWIHSTAVSSTQGNITILEFGAFVKVKGRWVERSIYRRPFNASEFADWYDCPDAIIRRGEKYTDNNNWTSAGIVEESVTLWYYIGLNEANERVVGYAEIQLVGELKK